MPRQTNVKMPTIEELRRVADFMASTMGLHSAAGKLLAKADQLERAVDDLMRLEE